MFCLADETISHIFFNCPIVHYIWSVFQCTFNSPVQPRESNGLGRWVNKFAGSEKYTVKICLAALFWSIWKTRIRACFENILPNDPCKILYQICHWIHYWSEMQKPEVQKCYGEALSY
jgi:hypothetical protein